MRPLSISATLQPRMKVRFLTSLGGKDFVYGGGEVLDLPTADAKYWIEQGLAEAVEEKPKQRPVRVTKVKAETRPVKK